MTLFEAADPNFEERVRESFSRQNLMSTIHARMTRAEPGIVEIEIPFDRAFGQQHGFVHAAIITAIADSACGYAALSLTAAGSDVLTVEYKANFLAPAQGDTFVARARVLRPGRGITVCSAEVFARTNGVESSIATMLATMKVMGGSRKE